MIEVLLLVLGLLAFGSYKKDFTALVFSGIGFILYGIGLYSINSGFGVVSIGFGLYVAIRAGLDLITFKKKEVTND